MDVFCSNNFKVQDHFETYAKKVDKVVEEALRSNIKQCMTQLCRAVSGDSKSSPSPLFKVLVTLRRAASHTKPKVQLTSYGSTLSHSYTQWSHSVLHSLSLPVTHTCSLLVPVKIEFSPSLKKLEKDVDMLPQLISTISEFKRLPELVSGKESQEKPIHISIGLSFHCTVFHTTPSWPQTRGGAEVNKLITMFSHPLGQDEEIRKIQAAVTAGMSAIITQIDVYRKSWDKYKGIWETDKDSFVQRYGRLNTPVSSFDADLNRYNHFLLWDITALVQIP